MTGTLPGNLKRKFWGGFYPTRYYPLKSQKHEKLLYLGVLWGSGNQCGIEWFFMILWISESFSLYLLVKNSLTLNYFFFTYFKYISGGITRKNILHSDYHGAGDIDAKKTKKAFHKLQKKFFSRLNCSSSLLWVFIVQNLCKNSFSVAKSRKNGVISLIKITFSLQKIPQNYRFPWVNTKTIRYTCRFNTS